MECSVTQAVIFVRVEECGRSSGSCNLLHVDALDDNLEDEAEEARLRAWPGVDPAHLRKVFVAAGGALEDEEREAARDLLQWCLARTPAERPQREVVNHATHLGVVVGNPEEPGRRVFNKAGPA